MTFSDCFALGVGNDVALIRRIQATRKDLIGRSYIVRHLAGCASQGGHPCVCVPSVRVGKERFV